MKKVFGKMYLGGALLLSLSMCLTSCEDVLGHWEKPTPPECTVTSISLNETSLDLFVEGGKKTATLTATLVGDPGNEQVEFSSGDDTRATVDPTTGEVTAVGGGEVTIYANIGPTLQAQCKVMVYDRLHDIGTDGAADIPAGKLWMITGDGSDKITINEGSIAYLNNVKITTTTESCIETASMGEIYLVDGTTNTMDASGANFSAAVNTKGGQLTIYGQTEGTGKLIAKGGACSAGIGGNLNGNFNSIVIKGGEIEATGGDGAAGIGSGKFDSASSNYTNGDITISGGTVTAEGKGGGAGIGTGYQVDNTYVAACGRIMIEKTVVSVTATMSAGASAPIGKGGKINVSAPDPFCGDIYFGPNTDPGNRVAPSGDYPIPFDAGPHGGLTLAISGNTWELTPTN